MKQKEEALLKIALVNAHTNRATNGTGGREKDCVNGAYLRGDQALHGNFIRAIT